LPKQCGDIVNKYIDDDTLAILLVGMITMTALIMRVSTETIVTAGLAGLVGYMGGKTTKLK
jgi:hypothetical protein